MKLLVLTPLLASSLLVLNAGSALAEVQQEAGSQMQSERTDGQVGEAGALGPEGTYVARRGLVESISGREFTIVSDGELVKVDTSDMTYNPLDKLAAEGVEVGDRVYVRGEIDDEFIDGKSLSANTVVVLSDASDQAGDS